MSFYNYLLDHNKRLHTARGYENEAKLFEKWAEEKGINPAKATYKQLLNYIDHCREKGNTPQTLAQKCQVLKHYFNYKGRGANPATGLQIQGKMHRLPKATLSMEELNALYERYNPPGPTGRRDKVMLGLAVFQGAGLTELAAIELKDVNLEKGCIYLPGAARSNGRLLELKAGQLPLLQDYLINARPALMQYRKIPTERLIISKGTSVNLNNTAANCMKKLKEINPKAKDFKQLRISVISHWVKEHGLRKAQYMAGHRYVSSTEKYRGGHLDDLQERLDKYHPLG